MICLKTYFGHLDAKRYRKCLATISHLILVVGLLSSCAAPSRMTQQSIEPSFDLNISMVNVGGFKLQMTPRAAMAVIKANGYRESSGNRVTLEDLISNPTSRDTQIEIFEFSYGESLDDRLLKETGVFNLEFSHGRLDEISYSLVNLTKEKLKEIRDRNEEQFHFVTERETSVLNGPRGGTVISWIYTPIKLAFLRINYIEREPRFAIPQIGKPGVGSCDYSITVEDLNPNLAR